MSVKTRIAPSPTGLMHIGTVRTALFNYLYAKQNDGTFVVRVEDTDKERGKPEWTEAIWQGLDWLGLTPDEKYIQSDHVERHSELLADLISKDIAYVSKELAKDGSGRSVEVVRLRNAGKSITFSDVVHGDITFDTTELGDFVIARTPVDPLYHFAVVVDDMDENITHVIRGEDHISNTPRQILIQEAIGAEKPTYIHLPLILAPDRSKLSKRKHGASVEAYREAGFLPEAMLNYLALLGWNPGTDQEIFSMENLLQEFTLEKIQKSPAIFDEEKLRWVNREHLLQLSEDVFEESALEHLKKALSERITFNESVARKLIPILRERIDTWGDIDKAVGEGEYDYFFVAPNIDEDDLVWKESTIDDAKQHLVNARQLLESAPESAWESTETIQSILWEYAEEAGKGSVLWPLRYALSGRKKSPDPFSLAYVLGKEEVLIRLNSILS